jgi:hypothetical protein
VNTSLIAFLLMFFRSWLGNGNAIVPVFEPVRNYSSTLRWILEGEDMPGDVLVVILVFLQSLLNDCSWPIAARPGYQDLVPFRA